MEKEFEHLTEKLENIHLLVQSDNFSEEHCNMIFNYSHELKLHNLRLSQMLAELPDVAYSVPQISEPCNMRNAVEYVDREHAYALNHNSAHLNLFSGIDISALLMNVQQLLMERIDLIITCITLEHSNLSLNHLPNDNNNVIGNIHFFNDVNSKMDIIRELYSLSVRPTSLQHNLLLNIMKKNVIVCGNRNDKSILFIIPLLHDFRPELNACQALVIVPTWEIAVYVKQVIESLRNFLGLEIHLFEGENHNPSVVPHIEVGLPGELQYKLTTEI